jgi:REP element-mobilizing transposase RayT
LTGDQAAALLVQFEETARHRSWSLSAAAIMANHFHLVVAAADEVAPERMLIDFKAYGTRILNRLFGPRPGGTWWTSGGSKRRLPNDRAVERAVEYVTRQRYPLVVWTPRQA